MKLVRPLASLSALTILLATYGLATTKGDGSDGTYRVTAYFEKAIGLFEKSDVDILGVPVGTVTDVEPEGTRVKVVMEVSDDYQIPADAFAQIVPISVISDRYVQFAPAYQGGPALQDGAVLGTDRTQIPAELDDVFKQLKKLLDAIEPGKKGEPGALGDLIVQLDETLSGREKDLRGTLSNAAQLTETLSGARDDISALLVNADDLFGKLATRAGSFGALNENLAVVLTTLAESRRDLEETIANLGSITGEVGDVVKDHHVTLARDLEIAARITATVLKNRRSVAKSLRWLPVVAEGFIAANHRFPGTRITAEDIRDNAQQRLDCAILGSLPEGPIKEALEEACREQTGQPQKRTRARTFDFPTDEPLGCRRGIRAVRHQLRRVARTGLPDPVKQEVLDPLRRKLRRLARECKELGEIVKDPKKLVDEILDELPPIGTIPELEDVEDPIEHLNSAAVGTGAFPTRSRGGFFDGVRSWMDGFLGFVGLR